MTIKELYVWAVKEGVEDDPCVIDERSEMPPYELHEGTIQLDDDGRKVVWL